MQTHQDKRRNSELHIIPIRRSLFIERSRDLHKFVSMIILTYDILGGLEVNKIKNMYDN